MKKIFLIFAALILLGGCMATINPAFQVPEHKKTTSFLVGQTQQANLGDSMVVEEDVFFYNGMIATSDYHPPDPFGTISPSFSAGDMFKLYGTMKDINGKEVKLYVPMDTEKKAIAGGSKVIWDYCIAMNDRGEAYGFSACSMGYVSTWPQPVHFLKEGQVYDKGSFKKELVYDGRAKDILKIAYREYKDDFARPAFQQELSYDLSESKNIGFRKIKIEIIEATNSYIKFIVQSPMN